MRIAIDVRHSRDYGIGTYIRNMVQSLSRIDEENHYILAGRKEDLREFGELPANFRRAVFPRSDSGLLNQISFPLFLRRLKPDLCHVPLNAAPLLMLAEPVPPAPSSSLPGRTQLAVARATQASSA